MEKSFKKRKNIVVFFMGSVKKTQQRIVLPLFRIADDNMGNSNSFYMWKLHIIELGWKKDYQESWINWRMIVFLGITQNS